MGRNKKKTDFLIVGGGIFGVYAALHLSRKGQRIIVLEKEKELMKKASIVNQARLHSGYHYPRSVATARMSDDNKQRFTEDHREFINFSFAKYYAIDKFGSFTDAAQFERFSKYIGIRCDRVEGHPLFNYNRLEALYETTEYSFDPYLIAQYYRELIEADNHIEIMFETTIRQAEASGNHWLVETNKGVISAAQVINATYSVSNAINDIFKVENIDLMHEISEIALLTSPQVGDIGLTVMDGPFGSVMPYGLSGLLSLSSVPYTHHKVSYESCPTFDCQEGVSDCSPSASGICNNCTAKPHSNYQKMKQQMLRYFSPEVEFNYFSSLFTIKSKLMANFIDDGRPTVIQVLNDNPRFYCIFAGKINSIYEIEKVVEF